MAGVNVISTYQSLLSDRDSDFDCYSAYCEAIDNSIQADAKTINIHFEKKGTKEIDHVIFTDNGVGMDKFILQRCLRLGYSSRFNDRSGIGRFGVGMTKGAIHECKRVEVYSKIKNGDWLFTYIDLDEIGDHEEEDGDNTWIIPEPKILNPKDAGIHQDHIPNEHGTIVIWKKYDRALFSYDEIIKNFEIYAGRTFRYYIWNINPHNKNEKFREVGDLELKINGRLVYAIDPLYFIKEKTAFPTDPQSEMFDPIEIDWPINDPRLEKILGRSESKILIKTSLTPQIWRSYQGAGNSDEAKKRFIDHNEGFSFIRHGREVGYDWIPRFKNQSLEIDRWWSAEICFEPELDSSFTVKNIKRGAVPVSELKSIIHTRIWPWVKQKREQIREEWKKNILEETEPNAPKGSGGHEASEKIAKKTPLPKGNAVSTPDEVAKDAAKGDLDQEKIWKARFESQPFSIKDDGWPGSSFIDINHMGGSDFLMYNTRHSLIDTLRTIQGEISDGINLDTNAERLNTLIDIIFMSFGKAKSMIDPDAQITGHQFQSQLINNWGAFLSSYIKTWQDEFDDELKG